MVVSASSEPSNSNLLYSSEMKEISFISDEYNKFELEGSLLADTTKPFDAVLGQFGRIVQL